MLLGIISDTHDRLPNVEKAVEIFNTNSVCAVLHCGDFVSPFSLLPFKKLKAPLYAVFGNNDGEREGLARVFDDNGWTLNKRPWYSALQGNKVAMFHEPDGALDAFYGGGYNLVVYGHTHEKKVEVRSGAMLVNPGEACGT